MMAFLAPDGLPDIGLLMLAGFLVFASAWLVMTKGND